MRAPDSFMGLFSGCGALLAALILLKIPSWVNAEKDTPEGIHAMYLATAGLVGATAIIVFVRIALPKRLFAPSARGPGASRSTYARYGPACDPLAASRTRSGACKAALPFSARTARCCRSGS